MSESATRTVKGKLIFIATADVDFEVPADVTDDKLEEVLASQLAAEDPISKLIGSRDVEYVRWLGLQSDDPPFAVLPSVEDEIVALDGGEKDEDEEDLNKLIIDQETLSTVS